MNRLCFLLCSIVIIITACQTPQENHNIEVSSKAQVKVTSFRYGSLPDYLSLTGTTIYYNKNTIVAPISGYVTKVFTEQGNTVHKGDILFEMLTKEAFAMLQTDSFNVSYKAISIKSPGNGIVTNLNVVQQGVYIEQGSAMCTIIGTNDLKIIAEVPFEYNRYITIGQTCNVIFPDQTTHKAVFTKILPQMNESTQTIRIQAKLETHSFIPEKMRIKLLINKNRSTTPHQILPATCVMSDALLSKYWVMRLLNDSTAVETPVRIGIQTHDSVEILSPVFDSNTLFIEEGAYGLEDTVLVDIIH